MSELLALYLMISLASGRNLDSKLLRICTPGNRLVQELAFCAVWSGASRYELCPSKCARACNCHLSQSPPKIFDYVLPSRANSTLLGR